MNPALMLLMRGAAAPPVSPLTFIGYPDASLVRAKTVTLPSVPLGDDFAGRQILVAIMAQTDSTLGDITSVTVAGVPFAIDITSGVTRGICGVARGIVSGTVGDVVIVGGSSTNQIYAGARVGIYHLAPGLAPISAAGGVGYDGSVSVAGGGHTVIAATRSTVGTLSSPAGATIDMHPDGESAPQRLSAHISGDGPYVLRSMTSGSPTYDRIAGVTYA